MGEVKHVSVPGGVGQDKIQTFILKWPMLADLSVGTDHKG